MTTTIGLLGLGKVGEKHLGAYRGLDVDVIATDTDLTKRAVADRFDAKWVDSPEDLYDAGVDAIDVCTPADSHAEHVFAALDADTHVFCEKPIATDAGSAETIRHKAQEADCIVTVGYLYRHHPAFQFVHSVLEDGIIGEPHFGIFRVGGRGSHARWKHDAGRSGGAATEMLVHMVDLVQWFFDDVGAARELWVETLLPERRIDGETVTATAADLTALAIDADEASLLVQADLVSPSYMNYVELHGSNGSVWASLLDHFPALVYCNERRGLFDTGLTTRTFDRVDLFDRELAHFVHAVERAVDRGVPVDALQTPSLDDAVATTALIDNVTGDD